jgi:hypothetical protein
MPPKPEPGLRLRQMLAHRDFAGTADRCGLWDEARKHYAICIALVDRLVAQAPDPALAADAARTRRAWAKLEAGPLGNPKKGKLLYEQAIHILEALKATARLPHDATRTLKQLHKEKAALH